MLSRVFQHTIGVLHSIKHLWEQFLHILLSVSAITTPLYILGRFGVLQAHPNFNSVVTIRSMQTKIMGKVIDRVANLMENLEVSLQ